VAGMLPDPLSDIVPDGLGASFVKVFGPQAFCWASLGKVYKEKWEGFAPLLLLLLAAAAAAAVGRLVQ